MRRFAPLSTIPGSLLLLAGLGLGRPACSLEVGSVQEETVPASLPAADPIQEDTTFEDSTAGSLGQAVEESRSPLPGHRAAQDEAAEAALDELFSRIPGLEGVEARVEAGVAFLTGTVLSQEDGELARSLAQDAQGIVYVDDRIREETSLRSRLGPMWERTLEKLLVAAGYVPLLLLGILIVAVFFVLGRMISRWEPPYRQLTPNPFLRSLLQQLTAGAVGLFGVLLALELLDATALVGALLGAAGVMGVAVGFAFRNIAENYLAGILLSLRQPFEPDDHIVVEGQEGKVIRLTSRETILMTMDGNHVRIPNATVFNSVILNYTRNPLRRLTFTLSIGQDQDIVGAQELGLAALHRLEGVLSDPPPKSSVVEVGDSWVLLRFTAWADQKKVAFDKVRSGAIRVVKEGLDAGGVAMPAPEYGLRFLGPSGVPMTPVAPEAGSAPTSDAEAGAGPGWEDESPPTTSSPPDVSLEDDLDRQIARDREEAQERDLLGGADR